MINPFPLRHAPSPPPGAVDPLDNRERDLLKGRHLKSVTIKDKNGTIIIKVIHRKNGKYELIRNADVPCNVVIEVRNDKGRKVMFRKE